MPKENKKIDAEKSLSKLNLNWFPGHMTKAKRKISENLKLIDVVVEIVDARVPKSSRNPDFDDLLAKKPRIIILNKCDLADPLKTKVWVRHYKAENIEAIATDCKSGKGVNIFAPMVKSVLKEKIDKAKSHGINKTVRAMIVGIPNVGKSSFINCLLKSKKAKVENKPGVTRGNQWFTIADGLEAFDTPGILWPKFDDASVAEKLAFIGSIKDQILDTQELAAKLLEYLSLNYRDKLSSRYKLDNTQLDGLSGYSILELIGKKRGMLLSGGEINIERTSIMILDEFRAAKIGRITLD